MKDLKTKIEEIIFVHEISCDYWEHKSCNCKENPVLDLVMEVFHSSLIEKVEGIIDTMRSEKEYINGNANEVSIKRDTLLAVKHRLLDDIKGEKNG